MDASAPPIDALCERLRAHYVFADRVEAMCAALRDVDTASLEGPGLAARWTQALQAVSPDRHLRVRWFETMAPDRYAADTVDTDARRQLAAIDRQGIHRIERLAGDIGLFELREFHPPDDAASLLAAAMTVLASCQALIFDLRACRGGEPESVALLAGHLFGDLPVHLNDLYLRAENRTQSFWTRPERSRPHCPDVPVHVLVGPSTFSAGEEFAYDLQALRRATVVGQPTRGGAHAGAVHALDAHFAVFIPDARAINPVTGGNWEGGGVLPDVACDAQQALQVAHRLLLQAVSERLAARDDEAAALLREEARAALEAMTRP